MLRGLVEKQNHVVRQRADKSLDAMDDGGSQREMGASRDI
jgi:hypothetical protein